MLRRVTQSLPLLALLCGTALLAACLRGGAPESALAPGEPWFRRDPWREAPPPPPAPPIEKIETPRPAGGLAIPSVPAAAGGGSGEVVPPSPGASADTITLKDRVQGFALSGKVVQASQRSAIMAYQGGGPYPGVTITDCVIRVEPGTLPDDRSFWGFRGYDLADATLRGVEITGFGAVTPKHDEGHAVYLNLAGALTLEDCLIHHNGGQGLQLVNRASESVLPPGAAQGAIVVRRTWFHENGFNPDRAGFQISIFGTGQDVVLEDVQVVAGRDGTPFPAGTGGGLLIEAEAPNPEKRHWWYPDADGRPPFTQGRVALDGVVVDHVKPNRPIVQIKGCRELAVRGSRFSGGRIELDDPTKTGRACGRITWQGNQGDAEVFVGGVRVGTADRDFVAVDGVVQE